MRKERSGTAQLRICSWLESFLLLLEIYSKGPNGVDFWASAQMQEVLELRNRVEALCQEKNLEHIK